MTQQVVDNSIDLSDALRTVSVNASYDASRALSKWLRRGVRLTADGFVSVPLTQVAGTILPNEDDAVAALHMVLQGDIEGDVLLMFPEEVGFCLVDMLMGNPEGTTKAFTDLEESCLQETANIVGTSFTNSLAKWLKLEVVPASPSFVYDMACAIIDPVLARQVERADEVLVAKTEFELDRRQLDWVFLLLPTADSLAKMEHRCESDRVQQNALHAIAVNGAFNASRALSKWLHRGVRLSTDGFVRVPLAQISQIEDPEQRVVGIHSRLSDQLHGHTLLVMPEETACLLVDAIMQAEPGTTKQVDDMAKSCLQETANILSSSFMNSLAKWLDITSEPTSPVVRVDMADALFDTVVAEQAQTSDDVLVAKSVFSVDGQWMEWNYYLLPGPSSMRLIEASFNE
ncbi:MAG: hypothetical protein ACE5GE_03065 [Phycisphaerae bacterium]